MPKQEITGSFQLSSEALSDLKRIFEEEYPEETFSDEEIQTSGVNLLRLFDLVLRNKGVHTEP